MIGKFNARAIALTAVFVFGCPATFAGTIVANNTDSGAVSSLGTPAGLGGNYFAGFSLGVSHGFHNFFSFDLAGVTGTVASATFNVSTYTISGAGPFAVDGGTFEIYATSLVPGDVYGNANQFTLSAGGLIGSIDLTSADSDKVVSIALNSTGLAFLTANAGNGIVIGGSLASAFGGDDFVFANSTFTSSNNLTITTTPEPSSAALAGLGLMAGLGGLIRRRRSGIQ